MLHLLKAELYQLFHRRSTTIWLLVAVLLSAAMLILPYSMESIFQFDAIPTSMLVMTYAQTATAMSFYFLLGLAVTAFNNANKNRILVNSVSYGTSRSTIYLVKYLMTLFLALLFLTVSVLTFGIVMQMLYSGNWQAIAQMVTEQMLPYLPIWLAYTALYISILFISDNAMPLITLMIVLVMAPIAVQLLNFFDFFQPIRPYLLTELHPDQTIELFNLDVSNYVALAYAVVFIAIGLFAWHRKEIK